MSGRGTVLAALFLVGAASLVAAPTTPAITAAATVTAGKAGLTASTSNQTGVTFTWSFSPSNGGTVTTGQGTNSITYTAGPVGTYTLSCVAKDAASNTATGTKSITVVAAPVAPTITAESAVTAGTTGHAASIAAQTGMTYTWTVVDGTITAGSTTTAATYTAGATAGTGALKLTCTVKNAANDTAATTKNIDVVAAPTGPITVSLGAVTNLTTITNGITGYTAAVPSQAGATYLWSITNGAIDAGAGTNAITFHPTVASGTVSLSCKVTNSLGANVTVSKSLTVAPKPSTATITTAANITQGSATHAISVSTITGATYAWSGATATFAAPAASSTNYTTTTTNGTSNASAAVLGLSCLVKNQDGTSATISKNVNVWAAPTVPTVVTTKNDGVTAETQVTAGTTLHKASIVAQNNATYAWSMVDGTATAGQTTTTVTFTAGATVGAAALKATCTVANPAGTTASGFATEDVLAAPVATITAFKGVKTGFSAVTVGNTSEQASVPAQSGTFAWTITGGTITAGQGTNVITYDVTASAGGTVALGVTVTNPLGTVATGSKSLSVVVSPSTATISTAANITQGSATTHAISISSITGATYAWSGTTATFAAPAAASTTYTTTTLNSTNNVSGTALNLSCLVTNADGASATIPTAVNVWAPPTVPTVVTTKSDGVTSETQVTAGTPLHKAHITALQNSATYSWSMVDGSITAGLTSTTVTFSAGSTVGAAALKATCTVTNPAGTTASGFATEDVLAAPVATITAFKGAKTNLANVTVANTSEQASVPAQSGTFVWTITGGTITAGQGTNVITYDVTAASGSTVGLGVTVTNTLGTVATSSKSLSVVAAPSTAAITTAANITQGSATTHAIAITSITGSTYAWSGATATFAAPAGTNTTYTTTTINSTNNVSGASLNLSCLVTNADGASATISKTVSVWAAPTAPTVVTTKSDGVTSETQVTAGTTLHKAHITALQNNATYAWTLTDGTVTAGQTSTTVTFTAGTTTGAAALKATCTVSNPAGTTASGFATEDVLPAPASTITASKGAASNLTVVTSGNTGITASVPAQTATFAWTITGGSITSGQGTNSITFSVSAAGGSTVTLGCTVTNSLGTASTGSKILSVVASPVATITAGSDISYDSTGGLGRPASVNSVNGASYAWTLSTSDLAHPVTPTSATTASINYKTAAVAGSTVTLQVTITTADGVASAPASKVVTVDSLPTALPITAPSPVVATFGGYVASVDPTGTTGLTYNWSTSTGVTITAGAATNSATFKAGTNGTATLKCQISNRAGATSVLSTLPVTINPNATITAASPVTVGSTASASVPAQGGVSYTWSIIGGTGTSILSGQGTANITYNSGSVVGAPAFTLQCVVASTNNSTTNTGTKAITTIDAPAISSFTASPITVGSSGNLVAVFSNGTGSVDQGVGAVTSGTNAPVSPRASTLYTLTVTNPAGTKATAQVTMTVNPGFYSAGNTMKVGAEQGHTSTLLENGTVLIAGGKNVSNLSSNLADLFTASTTDGTFAATGNLTTARSYHAAARLANGAVLLTGGVDGTGTTVATAEVFSGSTFTAFPVSMSTARRNHTATVMPDGLILLVGGQDNTNAYLNKLERANSSNFFAISALLTTPRANHTATLMPNGKILIYGGYTTGGVATATYQIFDPVTLTLSAEASAPVARAGHTATLLPDGKVLIFGGVDATNTPATTAIEYNASAGTWGSPFQNSSGSTPFNARINGTATMLPGGKLLLAGGSNGSSDLATAELFDYNTLASAATGSLSGTRSFHQATLINHASANYSKVLVSGGLLNGTVTDTAEMFDLAVSTASPTVPLFLASRSSVTAGSSVSLYPEFVGGTGSITGGAVTINAVSGRAVTVTPPGIAGNVVTYTLTVGAQTKQVSITLK
ncbi:MAG TPA: kelch repeat-containing protein [Holophagaceae bacterium]|nr:kelch repeat-containing protein [Holophagaceae bacterium]